MKSLLSKAEIKRRKQVSDIVKNRLGFELMDFQDMYLGDYVDWKFRMEEKRLRELIDLYLDRGMTVNDEVYLHRHLVRMSRENILRCEFIMEAKKGYDIKLERVIEKVVESGLLPYKVRVSRGIVTGKHY